MEERILQLERELQELKEIYYKDNLSALQTFRKDVSFKGKVSFYNKQPVAQGATVATVAVPSGIYFQAEANATVTAVNAIIARLQAYGLIA